MIGAKVAAPDRQCLTLTGDGAFMMQGSEISTASRYGIGAIWIVLNDDDLAMASQAMDLFFADEHWKHYYSLGSPDLATYARGLGAEAVTVHDVAEFREALERALGAADRCTGAAVPGYHLGGTPQVIVAKIDPNPIPPYYAPAAQESGL